MITCRVLHTKSLLSSPQTLCAATTNTSTRNTNTMDSHILPKAVEYLLTPLKRLSSPDQFMPAAALAQEEKPRAPLQRRRKTKERVIFLFTATLKDVQKQFPGAFNCPSIYLNEIKLRWLSRMFACFIEVMQQYSKRWQMQISTSWKCWLANKMPELAPTRSHKRFLCSWMLWFVSA